MKSALLFVSFFIAFCLSAQQGVTLPTTSIAPQFIANLSPGNEESSGLFYLTDTLYSINDSGNLPMLKALNPTNGQLMTEWFIANAQNMDWEALSASVSTLYIADIGNNLGNRQYFDIYQIQREALPFSDTLLSTKYTFYYPDQPIGSLPANAHNYDAEAFVYKNDSLHIFSKNWQSLWTKHYVLPCIWQDTIAAQLIDSFEVDGLITDAAFDQNTNQLYLLGYKQLSSGLYNCFMWKFWNDPVGFFQGNRMRIELGSALTLGQTEGICLTNPNSGFISSEQISSVITIPAKLHSWSVEDIMAIDINELVTGIYFFENTLYVPESYNEILMLFDVNRKLVLRTERGKSSYNLERLPPGAYYLYAHDWYYKWLKNN
jgi:hypothetical protein